MTLPPSPRLTSPPDVRRQRPHLLFIALISGFLLIQGVTAASLLIAADDSHPKFMAEADYICDGFDDHIEVQAALTALPEGGTAILSDGTFNCSGSITPAAGTSLIGQGPDATSLEFSQNGQLNVSEEYVTLGDLHIRGTNYTNMSTDTTLDLSRWLGVITIYASHARVCNVTGTADASIQAVFLLLHNPNVYAPILEDIEFANCQAIDTGTYGFLHNAWGSENTTIKNVRYENCHAINCGGYGTFNQWVTGFDFAELNDMEGLRVSNSSAEGSLESGFHFEWDSQVRDCVFINCSSLDNGRKPYPETYLVGDPDFFGSGFYIPGGGASLINCRSEGNSAFGYFIGNPDGMLLYNCTERETGRGRTVGNVTKAISYCILQSRPVARDPSLVMDHCWSIGSNGWALFACGAENIVIKNFTMIDPAGIDGKGAVLGCLESDLPVNSTIRAGIFNSTIDLTASGDRPQTLLCVVNSEGVTYSGTLYSDAPNPVQAEGVVPGDRALAGLKVLSLLSFARPRRSPPS